VATTDDAGAVQTLEPAQAQDLPRAEVESLPLRLYTNPGLNRLVPTSVAVRIARRVGRKRWEVRPRRDDALTWTRLMAPGDASADELEDLARAALEEQAVKQALFWRPWTATGASVQGIESLLEAVSSGRGAVISYPHLSEHTLLMLAIASKGLRLFLPRKRSPKADRITPDYQGLRRRELLQRMERAGSRWVGRGDAFELLRTLVESGNVVMIAVDVKGGRPSTYLGHQMSLARGPAELGFATQAPVFPAYAHRSGTRLRFVIEEPIKPSDFESADMLHHQLVGRAETVVRERLPELYPYLCGELGSELKAERKRRERV